MGSVEKPDNYLWRAEDAKFLARVGVEVMKNDEKDTVYESITEIADI